MTKLTKIKKIMKIGVWNQLCDKLNTKKRCVAYEFYLINEIYAMYTVYKGNYENETKIHSRVSSILPPPPQNTAAASTAPTHVRRTSRRKRCRTNDDDLQNPSKTKKQKLDKIIITDVKKEKLDDVHYNKCEEGTFIETKRQIYKNVCILKKEEIDELKKKYGNDLRMLMKISRDDRVVKLLGAITGDVIKVRRSSETSGSSLCYKIVITTY